MTWQCCRHEVSVETKAPWHRGADIGGLRARAIAAWRNDVSEVSCHAEKCAAAAWQKSVRRNAHERRTSRCRNPQARGHGISVLLSAQHHHRALCGARHPADPVPAGARRRRPCRRLQPHQARQDERRVRGPSRPRHRERVSRHRAGLCRERAALDRLRRPAARRGNTCGRCFAPRMCTARSPNGRRWRIPRRSCRT